MKARSGNTVLEVALWLPILFLLIVGMVQFGKITYLDYALTKILYSAARGLATQQVNLCDGANDAATQNAILFAINDPATGVPLISNLTADMFQVTTQCLDVNGVPGACDTTGCPPNLTGAQRPDFIRVTLSNGYPVQLRIPYILLDPIQLRPSATVPFSGSSL